MLSAFAITTINPLKETTVIICEFQIFYMQMKYSIKTLLNFSFLHILYYFSFC